jgi:hypothetical protein
MLGEMRNFCRIFVRNSHIPTYGSKVIRGEKNLAGWMGEMAVAMPCTKQRSPKVIKIQNERKDSHLQGFKFSE